MIDKRVTDLIEAVWQVLDDMGTDGKCCCGAAKAQLRVAYEPFSEEVGPTEGFLSLSEAERILRECA